MAPASPSAVRPTTLRHSRLLHTLRLCWLAWTIAVSLGFPPPALAQSDGVYTVAPGDTLGAIATRFGIPLDNLVAANGIADPNALAVGQVLVIPGASGAVGIAPLAIEGIETGVMRALPGDTPTSVAGRYTQDADIIARLNNVGAIVRFFPGQPIRVPAVAIPTPPWRFGAVNAVATPTTIVQGQTGRMVVDTNRALALTGSWLGQPIVFTPMTDDGLRQVALLPVAALQETGAYELVLSYTTARGAPVAQSWTVQVEDGGYESQDIVISEEKAALMTPAAIQAEKDKVVGLWSQVSPDLLWRSPFLRPIDRQYPTTSPFGTRRAYSVADIGNFHAGQDFGAPEGVLVAAPAGGIVVMAEPTIVRGNAVIIDHGRGIFTGYWHLSELKVMPGQFVNAGDVIGLVGNTGLSTGAHLHWEMRINGVAVTPMQFLEESPFE